MSTGESRARGVEIVQADAALHFSVVNGVIAYRSRALSNCAAHNLQQKPDLIAARCAGEAG